MAIIVNKVTSKTPTLPTTLLDLTQDTVEEDNLLIGETAHNREGEPVSGAMPGGTTDYNDLTNKPSINGEELSGNITSSQLGLVGSGEKGANNGVASLGSDGKVPSSQIPTADNVVLASAMTIGGQTVTEVESALHALKDAGGSGGTTNYNALENKPKINGNTLSGNQMGSQLGLQNTVLASSLTIGGQTVTEVEPALHALNNKPSGSGGHTIVDSDGRTYPARAKLKFVNATVTDDSTNDTTIVEAEGGGGGTIVVTPTVTNTAITYDGTQKSPTITRDTDHTYIQGDYEATNYGTYTFTIGLSGVNDVWSDNTTEPKTYTWSINYDGGTITPVNDIQTWLKCANIDDKAYTTLSEVLADHETLYALINSNNAMDYLVRSTDWVSGITADETAMEYIGHKNYASNTLLDDSTWCTTICNSAYFESVLRTKVPTMTSNTTPYGVASASGDNSGSYPAWKAFNSDDSVETARWMDYSNTIPHWIQYEFDESINIKKVNFVLFYSSLTYSNYIIKILASNDSSFSSVLYESPDITISNTNDKATYSYDTNSNVTAKFWRVVVPNGNGKYSNVKYSTFWDIQFYGRTDITENQIDIYSAASDTVYYMDNGSPVTVCTTDTTGHGTVSKSSLPNGTYTLYSTVAKDPENLSNNYSKSITIADNTLEIDLMPVDRSQMLYWWGYKNNIEQPITWAGLTFGGAVVFNTNYIYCTATSGKSCGIQTVNAATMSEFHGIFTNEQGEGGIGMAISPTKNWNDKIASTPSVTETTMVYKHFNFTSGSYYGILITSSERTMPIYALWYE